MKARELHEGHKHPRARTQAADGSNPESHTEWTKERMFHDLVCLCLTNPHLLTRRPKDSREAVVIEEDGLFRY